MLSSTTRSTILCILTLLLNSGCGGPPGNVMVGTARAPGADGLVEAEEMDGRGALVRIHMERLPAPKQLGKGLKYYVVWFEANGSKPVWAGSLKYQPEARTGDLVKACPFRQFRVRITAEHSHNPKAPGELIISERAVSTD